MESGSVYTAAVSAFLIWPGSLCRVDGILSIHIAIKLLILRLILCRKTCLFIPVLDQYDYY